jgi:glycosyltransferase involved in cell wall biosynthesis
MNRLKRLVRAIRDYYIIKNSGLFDAHYYLTNNTDVRHADINPLKHYVKHGGLEGRNPSAEFDGEYYLNANPDVKEANLNPLAHYIKHGAKENRPPNKAGLYLYKNKELHNDAAQNDTKLIASLRRNTKNKNVIVFHVFYIELVDDLIEKFLHLNGIDFVVTCRVEIYSDVKSKFEKLSHNSCIVAVENEGYDVLPFLKLLKPLNVAGYQNFIKLHTKRDHPNKLVSSIWRESLVDDLIRDNKQKDLVLNQLSKMGGAIVVGSGINYLSYRYTKYHNHNHNHVVQIAKLFKIHISEYDDWGFFAGTMFAGRVKEFQHLDNKELIKFLIDGNKAALGSGVDSSPYHALERLFCLLLTKDTSRISCVDYDISKNNVNPQFTSDTKPLMASAEIRYFHYKNKAYLKKIKLLERANLLDPWWCYHEYRIMDIDQINLFEAYVTGEINFLSEDHKKDIISFNFDEDRLKIKSSSLESEVRLNEALLTRNVCFKDTFKPANRINNNEIKVSVICQTYNHSKFIDQAIESMVNQKTNFKYEILIGDDCSTDDSAKKIAVWAKKYPDKIIFINREKNIGPKENFKDLLQRSKGKYIALNEGDDFWCSEHKLQKQVDYMEANLNCNVCFHQVKVIKDGEPDFKGLFPGKNIRGDILLVEDLFDRNYIQTNSVMYRKSKDTFVALHKDLMPGDWFRHILHSLRGEIHLLPDIMSVYRRHAGGIWSPLADPTIKFGYNQAVFFNELNRLTLNYFHKKTTGKIYHLFRKKFWEAFASNDHDLLFKLFTLDRSLSRYFFYRAGLADCIAEEAFVSLENFINFMKSLFSIDVLVTSYNHKEYLPKTLDSILNQKGLYTFRVLVSDDCSPDGTGDILEQYVHTYSQVIHNISPPKNLGMLKNMKHAFSKVSAEYLAICEGDDEWLSDLKLQKQLGYMLQNRDASMCFNKVLLDYPEKNHTQPHPGQEKIKTDSIDFKYILNTAVTANFSCCFYRTDFVKSIPESYFERKNVADWLFNLYMASFGKVGFVPELLSKYRVHSGGQWSGLSKEEQYARKQNAYKLYLELFPAYEVDIKPLIDVQLLQEDNQ